MKPKRQPRDKGFALAALIFFLTVASILIAAEVPSYLMEAQRQQELELIFRGQEYMRAIQKFQRKFHVYPPSIDALLNTNNIRFLRKAYTDPITGKPMRLIFLNADGSISGSVLYSMGASITNPTVGGAMGSNGFGNSTMGTNGLNNANGTNGAMSATGTTGSTSLQTGPRGATGTTGSTFSLGTFSTGPAGATGATGATTGFRTPTGGSTSASGTAGIIGVASDSDLPSIMVYNTRQKYKEWEFIALQQQASPTNPAGANGAQGGTGANRSGIPTGGTNGAGGAFGFGTNPTNTTTPTTTTKPPGT